jgi:hypothetical protein
MSWQAITARPYLLVHRFGGADVVVRDAVGVEGDGVIPQHELANVSGSSQLFTVKRRKLTLNAKVESNASCFSLNRLVTGGFNVSNRIQPAPPHHSPGPAGGGGAHPFLDVL